MVSRNVAGEVAFLFPGQGSQFPGMARDFHERYDVVKDLFRMASDVCGKDMTGLLFEGSEEDLKATENSQPAIVLAELAALAVLRTRGVESAGAAGHSLGEYSALVDAGVLADHDALRAVAARGAAMARAGDDIIARKGAIGMAAVMGMPPDAVREAIRDAADVWSANENAPSQVAIGGTLGGIEAAADALKASGARRIIPLKVSCPFHTPLMAASAQSMKEVLAEIPFADPGKQIWSNVTAAPVKSGDEARKLLVEQITHPVRWVDLTASIAASAPGAVYEVGPGKVLTGLWNKSNLGGTCVPAGSINDMDKI